MTTQEIKARLATLKAERKTADALVRELQTQVNAAQGKADALYNEEFDLIGKLEEAENREWGMLAGLP